MKVLFIGNILPFQVVELLKLSIAGKKYEQFLLQALNRELKENLRIISGSKKGRKESLEICNSYVFPGKRFTVLKFLKVPVLGNLASDIHFFLYAIYWALVNIKHKRILLILNSPLGLCMSALLIQFFLGVKSVSLTIDTPFSSENKFHGILGKCNYLTLRIGQRTVRCFSGVIVLNKKVITELKIRRPWLLSTVGCDQQEIRIGYENIYAKKLRPVEVFKAVYVGTFLKSKGTDLLLDAFEKMDQDKYQIHFFGYGPLEYEILNRTKACKNIIFRGRLESNLVQETLAEFDLLINPVITDESSHNFGFPSKLIEYFLSGRPVLTTRFQALPDDYLPFIYMIEDETTVGITKAIEAVSKIPIEEIQMKTSMALDYLEQNQTWDRVANNIIDFLNEL